MRPSRNLANGTSCTPQLGPCPTTALSWVRTLRPSTPDETPEVQALSHGAPRAGDSGMGTRRDAVAWSLTYLNLPSFS